MIEIKMLEEKNLKDYTLIEGFPGAGLVGPMTISYIIDKLQMKYVGFVESASFPPLVSIHKGEPVPPIRLYCSDKNKIVTIFAEFAITMDMVAELSKAVYDFVRANGIVAIYSIGGVPKQDDNEKSPFVVASTLQATKVAQNAGLKPIDEGVATGVSALLLLRASMDKVDDTNIMVPVQQNIIDPLYAEVAVQSINKLMNLNIDVTELDKEAKMVEAKIKDLINKHKETLESHKKEVDDSTGPSMYA
ncbi:MAG: proteasome assembly chaperone family protein [Candidatus Micrarchaeaceae archaeon]